MTDASSAFELAEFEHVEAAPGTVLLRVAARGEALRDQPSPGLLVQRGGHSQRHAALPSPGSAGDLTRLAYAAGAEVIEPDTTFALEFQDGSTVSLPAPSLRRARVPRSEARQRGEARGLAVAELEARLERERQRRMAAEAEARAARELAVQVADADREIGDLRADLAQRQRALEQSRARVEATEARAAAAQQDSLREIEALHEQVQQHAQHAAVLGERIAAADDATRVEAERHQADRAELERRLQEARDAQAAGQSQLEQAQRELARAQAEALEKDAAAEQVALARASEIEALRHHAATHAEHVFQLEAELAAARSHADAMAGAADGSAELLATRAAEIDLLRAALTDRDRELTRARQELLHTQEQLVSAETNAEQARELAAAAQQALEQARARQAVSEPAVGRPQVTELRPPPDPSSRSLPATSLRAPAPSRARVSAALGELQGFPPEAQLGLGLLVLGLVLAMLLLTGAVTP